MTEPLPVSTLASERENDHTHIRKRLSPQAYRIVFSILMEHQKGKCALCPNAMEQLDHINGNPSDNRGSNFQGLCAHCNGVKHGKVRTTDSVREREKIEGTPQNAPWEEKRHQQLETDYWIEAQRILQEYGPTVKQFEDDLAYRTNSSQTTARRWIDRQLSPNGPFSLSNIKKGKKTEQVVGYSGPI